MKQNYLDNYLFWIIMFLMPVHLLTWDIWTKNIALGCVGVLLVRSVPFAIKKRYVIPQLIKKWVLGIGVVIFTAFCYWAFQCPYNFEDILLISVPLILTFSSYFLFSQDNETFEKYGLVFCVVSAICAILILVRSGGFAIVESYRAEVHKNAAAPFFCQVGILALSFMLKSQKKLRMVVYLSVFVICMILPIVLRARTSMVAFSLASMILLYNKYRGRGIVMLCVLLLVIFLFWGEQLLDLMYASIVGGTKDLYDINSLSSGRTGRNDLAISYIKNNLLFGTSQNYNLSSYIFSDMYLIPHNFVIYTLVKYGVGGSIGFLFIYWHLIRQTCVEYRQRNLLCLGCLLIALIESLAEYCSPFGPGTTYAITYLVLGRSLFLNSHK